jgi:hypothetical protein
MRAPLISQVNKMREPAERIVTIGELVHGTDRATTPKMTTMKNHSLETFAALVFVASLMT